MGAWLLAICSAFGCSLGIEDVVAAGDAGAHDASSSDGGSPDAGVQAPDDFACLSELEQLEPWTAAAKFDPHCDDRRVYLIEDGLFPSSDALSVARTAAGQVGIAYYSPDYSDSGALHVAHFAEPTKDGDTEVVPTIEVVNEGQYTAVGRASHIAAGAEGPLHLAYLQDESGSGSLRYSTVTELGLSPPETTGVASSRGTVAIAPTGDLGGNVHLVYYQPGGEVDGGEIVSQSRDPMQMGNGWGPLLPVVTTLENDTENGIGQLSLTTDEQEIVHLAFHQKTVGAFFSQPKYTRFLDPGWAATTTIDNQALSGNVGWSIGLAVAGIRRYAVYYDFPVAGAGDLTLAKWDEGGPISEVVKIRGGVPPTYPLERAKIALDLYGQIHLLYFTDSGGSLSYARYSAAGRLLVEDLVAENIPSGEVSDNQLDFVVDENGRPHIVYLNELGEVHYATRLDR